MKAFFLYLAVCGEPGLPLFGVLFGIGMVMMIGSVRAKGRSDEGTRRVIRRRSLWLLVFGLGVTRSAQALWDREILTDLAELQPVAVGVCADHSIGRQRRPGGRPRCRGCLLPRRSPRTRCGSSTPRTRGEAGHLVFDIRDDRGGLLAIV